jgi:hypothetical protein
METHNIPITKPPHKCDFRKIIVRRIHMVRQKVSNKERFLESLDRVREMVMKVPSFDDLSQSERLEFSMEMEGEMQDLNDRFYRLIR